MNDNHIKKILENSKTIAMIGVSSEKKGEDRKNLKRKPANVVMKYMQDFGYKVIPVNPFAKGEKINGETVPCVPQKQQIQKKNRKKVRSVPPHPEESDEQTELNSLWDSDKGTLKPEGRKRYSAKDSENDTS